MIRKSEVLWARTTGIPAKSSHIRGAVQELGHLLLEGVGASISFRYVLLGI
jgi:hypothetical protein